MVSLHDLSKSLEDLNRHVCYFLVFLKGKAHDLLCADHVKLIHTPLRLLASQALREIPTLVLLLQGLRLIQSSDILTHGQFLHHLLELCVKVGRQVSVYLRLDRLRGSVAEQELLVEKADLVVDLGNVLKLVRIDAFRRVRCVGLSR